MPQRFAVSPLCNLSVSDLSLSPSTYLAYQYEDDAFVLPRQFNFAHAVHIIRGKITRVMDCFKNYFLNMSTGKTAVSFPPLFWSMPLYTCNTFFISQIGFSVLALMSDKLTHRSIWLFFYTGFCYAALVLLTSQGN